MENIKLPKDIINIIVDFHNYEKYYKPTHTIKLLNVLNDIQEMSELMEPILANIAKKCWGNYIINQYHPFQLNI